MSRTWHVGRLDPSLRGGQHHVSYEGGGLSVSNCPSAWRSMAFLDGPTHRLDRPDALWLDLGALDVEVRSASTAHSLAQGLAEEADVWRSWIWEDGRGEWHSRAFLDEAEAIRFSVDLSDVPDAARPMTLEGHLAALLDAGVPLPCPRLVERVRLPLLTDAGNGRACGFGRMVDATDILAAFWLEDVVRPGLPDVVGTWWRSRLDVGSDLAPRGAVLPCSVGEFAVTGSGRDPGFSPEPETDWVVIAPDGGFRPSLA